MATKRMHPAMLIPPPLLFVLSFLAGVGLQQLEPISVGSALLLNMGPIIGKVLIAAGAILALSCLGLFLMAHTTIIPFGNASSFITCGPYRLTRNPMYVSLVLVYLGVAGNLLQIWPLFLLPLPIVFIHAIVIPFEEAKLREIFGELFDDYCARVRRWL